MFACGSNEYDCVVLEEETKKTFVEAADILNKDFWAMSSSENEEINQTVNTQPLMLTAGVATWRYLQENNLSSPIFLAGHSLGEFSALVAASSLTFESALKVVKKRAELMQNAVPNNKGGMAAIIGLEDEKIIDICRKEQGEGVLQAVNFNSPGQVVIAGSKNILDRINNCENIFPVILNAYTFITIIRVQ